MTIIPGEMAGGLREWQALQDQFGTLQAAKERFYKCNSTRHLSKNKIK